MDEITKLYADLAADVFIEPVTRHRSAEAGTDPSCGSPESDHFHPAWVGQRPMTILE